MTIPSPFRQQIRRCAANSRTILWIFSLGLAGRCQGECAAAFRRDLRRELLSRREEYRMLLRDAKSLLD